MTKESSSAAAAAAKIAADLAMQTAIKAADLASSTAATAVSLANETSRTTIAISKDVEWMRQALVRIDKKLDELSGLYVTTPIFNENQKMTDDHEDRLRYVEKNIQIWAGGLAIIAFGFPILLKFFVK